MAHLEPNIVSAAPTPRAAGKAGDVPRAIRRRYRTEGKRVVRFYKDPPAPGARQPSFKDRGGRLETRSEDPRVLRDLAAIARARGWTEVDLSGTQSFQREAWVALQRQGVAVRGYQLVSSPAPDRKREDLQLRRAEATTAPSRALDIARQAATRYAVVERIVNRFVADRGARDAILERARVRLERGTAPRDLANAVMTLQQKPPTSRRGSPAITKPPKDRDALR